MTKPLRDSRFFLLRLRTCTFTFLGNSQGLVSRSYFRVFIVCRQYFIRGAVDVGRFERCVYSPFASNNETALGSGVFSIDLSFSVCYRDVNTIFSFKNLILWLAVRILKSTPSCHASYQRYIQFIFKYFSLPFDPKILQRVPQPSSLSTKKNESR